MARMPPAVARTISVAISMQLQRQEECLARHEDAPRLPMELQRRTPRWSGPRSFVSQQPPPHRGTANGKKHAALLDDAVRQLATVLAGQYAFDTGVADRGGDALGRALMRLTQSWFCLVPADAAALRPAWLACDLSGTLTD
jgi:hypothetical protein